MWVATNENGHQYLHNSEKKPVRGKDLVTNNGAWESNGFQIIITQLFFPNLKWEDEPVKLEIVDKEKAHKDRLLLMAQQNFSGWQICNGSLYDLEAIINAIGLTEIEWQELKSGKPYDIEWLGEDAVNFIDTYFKSVADNK